MSSNDQATQDRETLMRAILQAGQDAGVIRKDQESVSVSQCLFILKELARPLNDPADGPRA